MTALSVGSLVGGKYELCRLLGRGSMGEVWLAHHRALGQDVALKLLSLDAGDGFVEDSATASARFRFEARIAARLSRKTRHIVRVTDHGEDQGLAYLVMELLEGETLDRRLLLRSSMPPAEVARLVAQIARALEQAHAEGVVHRDLKPANLFLTRDEEGGMLVKLLDFGIARATRKLLTAPTFSTANGLAFGTPGYMSPEQASAAKVDFHCDLWALATVAYEALTGELPVAGVGVKTVLANLRGRRFVRVHERDPGLPSGLIAFFDRAFAESPDQRFGSASELAREFRCALDSSGASVMGATGSRWRRRASRLALAAAGLVVASLIAFASLRHTRVPAPPTRLFETRDESPEPTQASLAGTPPSGGSTTPQDQDDMPVANVQARRSQPDAPSHRPAPTTVRAPASAPPSSSRAAAQLPYLPPSAASTASASSGPLDRSAVF